MAREILAVLDDPVVASLILSSASHLALQGVGSLIHVLAIRTPPLATILPTEEMLTETDEQRIASAEAARMAGLRTAYDAWLPSVAQSDLSALWHHTEGLTEVIVGQCGRRVDLIVLKRP